MQEQLLNRIGTHLKSTYKKDSSVTKDGAGNDDLIMTTIHSEDTALGNTDAPSVKETWFN